ncbi:MAG: MATE family efflux transporter [Clostridia bacterium]|nr:MATE family efflux transporter [Clostridia bacterium]
MLKLKSIDATRGALLPSIFIYALPIAITSLIQTLFSAVDTMVLRYMADTVAVASVGATSTITGLLINTFMGLAAGTKVLLARFIGAREKEQSAATVSTSLITAAGIGLVSAALGFGLSRQFLALTNCPAECFEGAMVYLRIYFLSAPAILVYNFGAEVLRVSGDTQRPLIYMLLSGLLNVVLNLILCLILPQKIAAVAIATVASQVLGAVLVVRRLCRIDNDCRVELRHLIFHRGLFSRILKFGLPIALHTALFPLANLQIQSAINSYGYAAVAGNAAAISLEGFISSITNAFGNAALTFIGQNLGAGQRERVNRSFALCLTIGALFGLVLGTLTYAFGEHLLVPFVGEDPAAIEYGMLRAKYIIFFYWMGAMNGIFGNVLQAFGYSFLTSLNSIFSVFIFRMIWMNFIYTRWPSYENIFHCFFVSWIILFTLNISMLVYVFHRYRQGRLQRVI